MSRAWLSLGSNLAPEANLRAAAGALRQRFGAVLFSPVYRTPAVGFDGPDFLNAAAIIRTGPRRDPPMRATPSSTLPRVRSRWQSWFPLSMTGKVPHGEQRKWAPTTPGRMCCVRGICRNRWKNREASPA